MQTHALGNILRVISVDISQADFIDEDGFFIRAETEGYIRYCPLNNKSDAEAITKYFDASTIFIDPEICRKIFVSTSLPIVSPELEPAGNLYVGYGV